MPTIEELISNLNYNQNVQPFDFGMDRDLEVIVNQLKRQKKSNFFRVYTSRWNWYERAYEYKEREEEEAEHRLHGHWAQAEVQEGKECCKGVNFDTFWWQKNSEKELHEFQLEPRLGDPEAQGSHPEGDSVRGPR